MLRLQVIYLNFIDERIASSEMLRRVELVRTDVSEERSSSIIRATRIGELGITFFSLLKSWISQNFITIKTSFNTKD
jgi:hypothetical protein